MKQPEFLKEGDTILLIATARARDKKQIQPAVKLLQSWGLKVIEGKNLYKKHHQFAGTDEERIEDLQWAINHPKAKAVLVAGGGYGTVRLIDKVDFSALKKNPKWFAGYSDVTVLHSKLLSEKINCIHSTLAFQLADDAKGAESLKKILFGQIDDITIKPNKLNQTGTTEGKIIGGNLSILYSLSGSPDDVNTKNKILFIEDIDEQLYHIDRMMMQLKRSGKLDKLKGVIVGGMTDMKDNAVPFGKTAEEIIRDVLDEFEYPICFDFPAGHIKNNQAFILGKKIKMDVSEKQVIINYL
ncbi:MAG: LD-carboxypeptidase [Bacteroidia bacterium]